MSRYTADFTVLDRDPFAVPPEEIAEIGVWGTVRDGVVHPVERRGS